MPPVTPRKFVKIELTVEAATDYEAEENIRDLLIEGGFVEGESFWIDESGDVAQ